ncbi:MAG TPA: CarD family transcriptional regulator [Pyrinomonadaceae bacterium]|jgi:CarD family transcriptional regulator|nr:CarD family transcriptional regulator [Pyrinomonadaceae bacterium]
MDFKIGQQVVYPNHGVGTIEKIEQKQIGTDELAFYNLRLAFNNSLVLVPVKNAEEVGLRCPITRAACDELLGILSEDFSKVANDWKIRFREYTEDVRSGDIFAVADILKKLTFLSRHKSLSFREQRLLEKARYLVVSELAAVCRQNECKIEERVEEALTCACAKHQANETPQAARAATAIH